MSPTSPKGLLSGLSFLYYTVVVRGYEDGVNEVDCIAECKIKPFGRGNKWYYGFYEKPQDGGKCAVFISSSRDDIREYTDV